MAAQKHVLSAGDPGRGVGLVYLDAALAGGPATHVLVIGVAAYRSAKFKKPLDTATISARAVADWFVDAAKARFNNPDCALGSVAIALSETPGAAKASYGSGEVPRADFASVKAAVRAWVKRINSHRDNLAVLYVAAHGESHLDRTAFLLEDYDTDELAATFGMSEIEQFVGSLENATPIDQLLLFDCCRAPTDMTLPWNTPLGDSLIALTRQTNDHGEPRKQWVIAATSLGEYATGMAAGPTLFNRALIDALNGVASDASEEGWPVRPGALFDKIDRILALHRLPDERPQTPAGRMAGSFTITYPGEPADVPVYVALEDPADWPDCSIRVTINGDPGDAIVGKGDPPFHVLRVPELADLRLAAERDAASLGQAHVKKVRGPAVFVEIKDTVDAPNPVVGQLDSGRSVAPMARILIVIDSPTRIDAGAVAEVQRRDEAAKPPKTLVVTVGGETPLDVRPGEHVVTVRMPDGQAQTREVTLAKDKIVKVAFSTRPSPHEWLASAAVAGAIREPSSLATSSPKSTIPHTPPPDPVQAGEQGFVTADLAFEIAPRPTLDVRVVADDGRFLRLGIEQAPDPGWDHRIPFARIAFAGRVELAVLPHLDIMGRGGDEWRPYVVVDRAARPSEPLASVVVESGIWEGLLGFLGSRDIAAGTLLLDDRLHQSAVQAIADKVGNAYAAVAGALMAVAASSPDIAKRWDPWLENLANWFPSLPDGPIILGRRLLMRARSAEDIAVARGAFVDGFKRGVPVFSMSADWLARGFESLPGDDAELLDLRTRARRLANRIDRKRPFTVIRVSG